MPSIPEIFANMQTRYNSGVLSENRTYYFSVGDHKYTVKLTPEACEVEEGRSGDADCILKATPDLFEKMVIKGKTPGPMDIMRGRIKTNDPAMLAQLKDLFTF
ncbi:MAG: SCP2 sterol-binding domain-containing protein [Proteobacteria bacterium]|nr:SCP2 sterol-binding domain-containing protein [Pseudomonadota bacterium]